MIILLDETLSHVQVSGYFRIGPEGRNDVEAYAIQNGDCVAIVLGVQTLMILCPHEDGLYVLAGKAQVAE